MTRRKLLFDSYLGLGGLALVDMLAAESNPMTLRQPHHACKAKSCIFLFMEGGVSQMDTFEYKPALVKYAGKQMPKAERTTGEIATIHGLKVDNNNHGPAVYHSLTGNMFPGSASIGAWVTYGLGSENKDLPG